MLNEQRIVEVDKKLKSRKKKNKNQGQRKVTIYDG